MYTTLSQDIISPITITSRYVEAKTKLKKKVITSLTLTNCCTPAKTEAYAAAPGYNPLSAPSMEVKKTMEPPALKSRILRPTAFNKNHAAIKFIFTIFLNSLSANSICSCIFPVKNYQKPNSIKLRGPRYSTSFINNNITLLIYLRNCNSWQKHPISPKSGMPYQQSDGKPIRFGLPCSIQRPAQCLCRIGRGNPWFCRRCSAGNSHLPAKPTWTNRSCIKKTEIN